MHHPPARSYHPRHLVGETGLKPSSNALGRVIIHAARLKSVVVGQRGCAAADRGDAAVDREFVPLLKPVMSARVATTAAPTINNPLSNESLEEANLTEIRFMVVLPSR